MTKTKTTITTTFAITFLAVTLLMMPATSGTAFANHTTTVSPSGESTVAYNGNCYAYIPSFGIDFASAATAAATKSVNGVSGHLVTYSDAGEEAASDASGANAKGWIGYTQDGTYTAGPFDGAGFGWVDGSAVGYTNWAAGEPNNAGGVEDYVENNQAGSAWNDVPNSGYGTVQGYYVEFDGACPAVDDEVCDDTDQLCKTVVITEHGVADGIIEVNELIQYDYTIDLNNNDGQSWFYVTLQDHGFGADTAVGDGPVDKDDPRDVDAMSVDNLDCELTQSNNKSKKEKMDCIVDSDATEDDIDPTGDEELSDGEHASVSVTAYTDINPGQGKKAEPKREYTSCGIHSPNSGAVVEYFLTGEDPEVDDPHVLATPAIYVEVFEFADLSGDCDEDGFSDGDEINTYGTDPFDPADQPTCDGINTTDICVDGDGTASPNAGTFQVVWGDPLTSWPTGFDAEGLDWFDKDASCTWTAGDDLHVEGAAYPTANRNAIHDNNVNDVDPLVLDLNLDLADGTGVDVDLETGTAFTGCAGPDPLLKFNNANGITNWDDGEDIILDVNGNGIFD